MQCGEHGDHDTAVAITRRHVERDVRCPASRSRKARPNRSALQKAATPGQVTGIPANAPARALAPSARMSGASTVTSRSSTQTATASPRAQQPGGARAFKDQFVGLQRVLQRHVGGQPRLSAFMVFPSSSHETPSNTTKLSSSGTSHTTLVDTKTCLHQGWHQQQRCTSHGGGEHHQRHEQPRRYRIRFRHVGR